MPAPIAAASVGRLRGTPRIIAIAGATAISLLAGFTCSGHRSLRGKLPGFGAAVWPGHRFRADHLGSDIAARYPPDSHEAKLAFRVAFPLLVRFIGIDRPALPWWFLGAAVLSVLLVAIAAERHGDASPTAPAWASLAFVALPAWSCIVAPSTGFADGLAICFGLAVLACGNGPAAAVMAFVALWTDERAALTLACIVMLWTAKLTVAVWPAATWSIGVAALAYAISRVTAAGLLGWTTVVGGVSLANLGLKGEWTQLALWNGGQSLWFVPVLMVLAIRSGRLWQSCLTALVAVGILGSFLVADVTRSLDYLLPRWLPPWFSRGVAASVARFDPSVWWRCGLVGLALVEPNFEVVQHVTRLIEPQWTASHDTGASPEPADSP